jgi:hypothetical protein
MKLITIATHSDRYFPILLESCKRYGAELIVLGWGMKWNGFMMKFNLLKDYLKTLDSNEIVCIIDAYDVILLNTLDVLEEKFRKTNANIIVAREGCDHIWLMKEFFYNIFFGKCNNVAINAGTYIGYVNALLEMIENICNVLDCTNSKLDDQIILTNYCKKNNIYIDLSQEIFLVNCYIEKITIDKLKTSCIYHAPGDANINKILIELGYDVSKIELKQYLYYLQFIKHHIITILIIIILFLILYKWIF